MNPLSNERDAFRVLLLVVAGALGVGAAGALGDGWTALATFLALIAGVCVGLWIARQGAEANVEPEPAAPVSALPVLLVAPVELAGPALAHEVVTEEGASAVRAVLLASEDELGGDGESLGRRATRPVRGVKRLGTGDLGCSRRREEGCHRRAARRRAQSRLRRDAPARPPCFRARGDACARDRRGVGDAGGGRCVRGPLARAPLAAEARLSFAQGSHCWGGSGTEPQSACADCVSGSFGSRNPSPAQVATKNAMSLASESAKS